jgi:hypothetical protein
MRFLMACNQRNTLFLLRRKNILKNIKTLIIKQVKISNLYQIVSFFWFFSLIVFSLHRV